MSKKNKLIESVQAGAYKKALSIARKFSFGFTAEEKRVLEIAADVMNGKGDFYASIGIDTQAEIKKAEAILLNFISK